VFWVVNINAVNIILIRDEALVKVNGTVWRFSFSIRCSLISRSLERGVVYFLLFGCTQGLFFCVLYVVLCCHRLERFGRVDVFVAFLLYFLADLFANLLQLKTQLVDFLFLLVFWEYSTLFLTIDVLLSLSSEFVVLKLFFHLNLKFEMI
jgi:hypothetical protein